MYKKAKNSNSTLRAALIFSSVLMAFSFVVGCTIQGPKLPGIETLPVTRPDVTDKTLYVDYTLEDVFEAAKEAGIRRNLFIGREDLKSGTIFMNGDVPVKRAVAVYIEELPKEGETRVDYYLSMECGGWGYFPEICDKTIRAEVQELLKVLLTYR